MIVVLLSCLDGATQVVCVTHVVLQFAPCVCLEYVLAACGRFIYAVCEQVCQSLNVVLLSKVVTCSETRQWLVVETLPSNNTVPAAANVTPCRMIAVSKCHWVIASAIKAHTCGRLR
jgi:hypothetical protein